MILIDDRQTVRGECPEAVDAAAHALPVATPGAPLASDGPVVGDRAPIRRSARPDLNGETASESVAAVAAVAAVATLGDVMIDGAIGDRQDRNVRAAHEGVEADVD